MSDKKRVSEITSPPSTTRELNKVSRPVSPTHDINEKEKEAREFAASHKEKNLNLLLYRVREKMAVLQNDHNIASKKLSDLEIAHAKLSKAHTDLLERNKKMEESLTQRLNAATEQVQELEEALTTKVNKTKNDMARHHTTVTVQLREEISALTSLNDQMKAELEMRKKAGDAAAHEHHLTLSHQQEQYRLQSGELKELKDHFQEQAFEHAKLKVRLDDCLRECESQTWRLRRADMKISELTLARDSHESSSHKWEQDAERWKRRWEYAEMDKRQIKSNLNAYKLLLKMTTISAYVKTFRLKRYLRGVYDRVCQLCTDVLIEQVKSSSRASVQLSSETELKHHEIARRAKSILRTPVYRVVRELDEKVAMIGPILEELKQGMATTKATAEGMFQRTVHLSKTNLAYVAKLARARARVQRWKTAYRAVQEELERLRKTDGKDKMITIKPSRPTSSSHPHRPASANVGSSPPTSPPSSTSFPALSHDETRPSTHDGVMEESKTPPHPVRRRVHDVHSRNQSLSLPPGATLITSSSNSSSRARSVLDDDEHDPSQHEWEEENVVTLTTRAEDEAIIEQAMNHVEKDDQDSDSDGPDTRRQIPRRVTRTQPKRPITREKKPREESKQEIRPMTSDSKHISPPSSVPTSSRILDLARPRMMTPNVRVVDETPIVNKPNPYAMVSREYESKIHTLIKQQHMQYAFTNPHPHPLINEKPTSPRPKVHQLNALHRPSSSASTAATAVATARQLATVPYPQPTASPPIVRRSQALTLSQQQRQQQQQQLLQQLKQHRIQPLRHQYKKGRKKSGKKDVMERILTDETTDTQQDMDCYPEYQKILQGEEEDTGEDGHREENGIENVNAGEEITEDPATTTDEPYVDPLADDIVGDAKVESLSSTIPSES